MPRCFISSTWTWELNKQWKYITWHLLKVLVHFVDLIMNVPATVAGVTIWKYFMFIKYSEESAFLTEILLNKCTNWQRLIFLVSSISIDQSFRLSTEKIYSCNYRWDAILNTIISSILITTSYILERTLNSFSTKIVNMSWHWCQVSIKSVQ